MAATLATSEDPFQPAAQPTCRPSPAASPAAHRRYRQCHSSQSQQSGPSRVGSQSLCYDQQRQRSGVRPPVLSVQTLPRQEDPQQAGRRRSRQRAPSWLHAPLAVNGGCVGHVRPGVIPKGRAVSLQPSILIA